MSIIRKVLNNPLIVLAHTLSAFSRLVKSDRKYIEWMYFFRFGKRLDLSNPKTFNEKLQWLKLFYRKREFSKLVDKYEVKSFIREHSNILTIPTIAVYDKIEDIDINALPNSFVIKTTHDSGGYSICRDKKHFDWNQAKLKLTRSLKHNYYLEGREYPYKHVKPRIIVEKYMVDESGYELKDYKFFCFGGKVYCFKIDFGRSTVHHANYYDREYHLLSLGETICPPQPNANMKFPNNLQEMIREAEKLSKGFPFLRVDFYNINNDIYFGELTFYPNGGMGKFIDKEWNEKLGSLIKLPKAIIDD